MSVTYKGPDGWLYRASERPDAKGEYYIEYRDPATSAVYKPLPGYNGSANRAEIAHRLANDCSLKAVEDIPATAAPAPASSPASAEPPEIVDECSEQDTQSACACQSCENFECICAGGLNAYGRESCNGHNNCAQSGCSYAAKHRTASKEATPPTAEPAAIAVPPAADIAAPGFDYTQVDADTANLLRELESGIAENQKTAVQVASAIGEKLQRGHDYLAKKGYGCYGEWCESLGYNRTQAKRLTNLHNFVCNTMLQTERDAIEALPLTVAYQVANPNMPEEVKEAARHGDISTLKELEELRAQLKAEREGRETAERETREALAWKQHAEGQAEDAKAAIHAAQQTAQEAQRAAETLKQQIYRRNEELAEKEQALNTVLDQQGEYIAKIRELEKRPKDVDVVVKQPSEADIERWRKEGEERARAALAGQAPTVEELTNLANGYAAQIDGMRAVLAQLSQGMEHQAVTRAADKLCLAADRLHDLILYGAEDYGHG